MRLHPLVLAAAISLAVSPLAHASETPVNGPWQPGSPRAETAPVAKAGNNETPAANAQKEKAETPWYGRNNMHKYLGLGSIGAAALTIVAPKKEGGPHERFAQAAAALGVAAVGTGFYAHSDDLSWSWSNPDTRHATLGALGTLGFIMALARGGEGGHAGAGALGAIAMATAIKITW